MAFRTLAHHIDIEWLCEAYRRTRKDGGEQVVQAGLRTQGRSSQKKPYLGVRECVRSGWNADQFGCKPWVALPRGGLAALVAFALFRTPSGIEQVAAMNAAGVGRCIRERHFR
jgi:hypothetical protein